MVQEAGCDWLSTKILSFEDNCSFPVSMVMDTKNTRCIHICSCDKVSINGSLPFVEMATAATATTTTTKTTTESEAK